MPKYSLPSLCHWDEWSVLPRYARSLSFHLLNSFQQFSLLSYAWSVSPILHITHISMKHAEISPIFEKIFLTPYLLPAIVPNLYSAFGEKFFKGDVYFCYLQILSSHWYPLRGYQPSPDHLTAPQKKLLWKSSLTSTLLKPKARSQHSPYLIYRSISNFTNQSFFNTLHTRLWRHYCSGSPPPNWALIFSLSCL